MFVRLVYESFRRQTRRKLLVAIAVTLGATAAVNSYGNNRFVGNSNDGGPFLSAVLY